MAQTNLMRADEIASAFNSAAEPRYWKASVAGTRVNPEVHFNSRSSMVRVTYRVTSADFTVAFSKSACAFGDFLASAQRSLAQVLTRLNAAGLPFVAPLDANPRLRIEYDPVDKCATAALSWQSDSWLRAEPLPFKVPERNNPEDAFFPVDGA
jgi:hypothetical protein